MSKATMDIQALGEIPVKQFRKFLTFIAEHNLWDELETHLNEQGCDKLLMSWYPIHAVATIVESKSREMVSARRAGVADAARPDQTVMRCASNGPLGPRPGPVTPSNPDGGAPDGGH